MTCLKHLKGFPLAGINPNSCSICLRAGSDLSLPRLWRPILFPSDEMLVVTTWTCGSLPYIDGMEKFEVYVEHRGVIKTFFGTFGKYGWSYRFTIDVDGVTVIFEPDEERNLRAIVPSVKGDDSGTKELVVLIAREIEKLMS